MSKGFIQIIVLGIVGIAFLTGAFLVGGKQSDPEQKLGLATYKSIQVGTDPDNGDCLTTDGTDSVWGSCSAGGGEANTASNLGTGLNIFDTKSGVDLRFNSIAAGSNITLSTTTNANTIVIASTATGGGASPFESNTSWGALAQATSSILQMNGALISSSTIGQLTVGSITATSSVSFPASSITNIMLQNSSITFGNGSNTVGSGAVSLGGSGSINLALSFNPLSVGYLVSTSSATSTFSGGLYGSLISAPYFHATSSTATSTFTGGIKAQTIGTGLVISSSGDLGSYAGTSCTNQALTALNASGSGTCATITSSYIDSSIAVSARQLTIAGTANQITSSAGAQDLTADRTWTLSLPQAVLFPGYFSTSYGTSTLFASASSTIGKLTVGTITATSTLTIASTTSGCVQGSNGLLFFTGTNCGSGTGGASPFESNTSWGALAQATTSLLAFPQSLISSSTIGFLRTGWFNATSTTQSSWLAGVLGVGTTSPSSSYQFSVTGQGYVSATTTTGGLVVDSGLSSATSTITVGDVGRSLAGCINIITQTSPGVFATSSIFINPGQTALVVEANSCK